MLKEDKDLKKDWHAWGSWFSWGSPVGLGIYLLSLAGAVWIFCNLKPRDKK
jgi:hypothetical protein